jgi:septation ring formation regulator EzrA
MSEVIRNIIFYAVSPATLAALVVFIFRSGHKFGGAEKILDSFRESLTKITATLDKTEMRFERVEEKLGSLRDSMNSGFKSVDESITSLRVDVAAMKTDIEWLKKKWPSAQ